MQTRQRNKLNSDPKTVTSRLKQYPFSLLVHKANKLAAINQLITEILPAPINTHCWVMNTTENTLTLGVDSAGWATRLRTMTRDLLQSLHYHDALTHIKRIHCKISKKPTQTTSQPPRVKIKLTRYSSQIIKQSAEAIKDDQLREALLQLAQNGM